MRVIAGKYRSRLLTSLRELDLRPTADRLRETLFNVLTAGNPAALEGSIWLDLFAGTGAVGIEAISRGAGFVYFVESSARAAALIRRNLGSLGVDSLGAKAALEVIKNDVFRALRILEASDVTADYVFLDPPYRMQNAYAQTLELLARSPIVRATTIVVAEHSRKFDLGTEFEDLRRYRTLRQGDSALSFYRKN